MFSKLTTTISIVGHNGENKSHFAAYDQGLLSAFDGEGGRIPCEAFTSMYTRQDVLVWESNSGFKPHAMILAES